MPTQSYFNKYPSFPSDVTTAQLPRLSFSKNLNYEKAESDAFFKEVNAKDVDELMKYAYQPLHSLLGQVASASSNAPPFPMGSKFLIDPIHILNHLLHQIQPNRQPQNRRRPSQRHATLQHQPGQHDRHLNPLSNPPSIEAYRSEIKAYVKQAYPIVSLICSHLDRRLHLPPSTLILM